MNLGDGSDANWYMDTGATSHLASGSGILKSSSNNCPIKFVLVGNGSARPVTKIGWTTLLSKHRLLHLNQVLITPKIIKILFPSVVSLETIK